MEWGRTIDFGIRKFCILLTDSRIWKIHFSYPCRGEIQRDWWQTVPVIAPVCPKTQFSNLIDGFASRRLRGTAGTTNGQWYKCFLARRIIAFLEHVFAICLFIFSCFLDVEIQWDWWKNNNQSCVRKHKTLANFFGACQRKFTSSRRVSNNKRQPGVKTYIFSCFLFGVESTTRSKNLSQFENQDCQRNLCARQLNETHTLHNYFSRGLF